MSVITKGRHFSVVVVGSMFLMLATVTATKVRVDVDVHMMKIGDEIVCKNKIKTNIDGKLLESCERCPKKLPNGTWLSYEPKESSKIKNIRIPTDLYPESYELELFPKMTDPDPKKFIFTGKVKIKLHCRNPTSTLTLHVKDLNIEANGVLFNGTQARHSRDTERDFLLVHLDKETIKNSFYEVEINFNAPLTNGLKGLYYSKYTRDKKPVYLATTHFQPINARRAFPCFDEPGIKSTFTITLVRPHNYVSLSNMLIRSDKPVVIDGLNYVKDTFMKTPKMSTYLLAFVICDFVKIENKTENGVIFRVWSRPDAINETKYSFNAGLKILTYFENFFNVRYPLPKLDMIAIPDFEADGMENWGLMIIKEHHILTTIDGSHTAVLIVSHEIAHQWFGDLVSPAWWDDLWLNEGFSTYAHYLGMDYCHPEWKMFTSFIRDVIFKALSEDSLVSSHPIIFPPDVHPLEALFDSITYSKAPAVIRMMRHFLGYDTFTKGLGLYLERHKNSAATRDDLWLALTEQSKLENKYIDVKEVMDTWVLQMNYPLVTVSLDLSGNSFNGVLKVQQKRFLLNYDSTEIGQYVSPFNYTWSIPLTFATNFTRNFNESNIPIYWIWKNETSKLINVSHIMPSKETWFICNINMNGLYRVNYDRSNWMALTKQLKEDPEAIPVISRVQIIADAFYLARASILPYEVAFIITEYLEKEKNSLAWDQALGDLDYIGAMLSSSPIYGLFQKLMRKKIGVLYQDLKEKKKSGKLSMSENGIHKSLTPAACKYEIQDCIDDAVGQFKSWMDNPKNRTIDSTWVYCKAIFEGGEKEWNFLFEMFKADASFMARYISNLACASEPWLMNRMLHLTIAEDSPFHKSHMIWILPTTAASAFGRVVTWDFFRTHFKQINRIYGTTAYWSYIIDRVTKSLNTESQLKAIKAFKLEHGHFGSGETPIQQAILKVEANVQWMKTHYKTIEAWLKANAN